jgi:hypothetical protein
MNQRGPLAKSTLACASGIRPRTGRAVASSDAAGALSRTIRCGIASKQELPGPWRAHSVIGPFVSGFSR